MHRFSRMAIVIAAIVIFHAVGITAAQCQVQADPFSKAIQLEKDGKRNEVIGEYRKVFSDRQRRDRGVAAEALYRGGEYAWKRFPRTEAERKVKLDEAWQMWKQLRDEFGDTPAGKALTTPTATEPDGPVNALTTAIDRRNSSNMNYKLMDSLVAVTGRSSSFSYAFALIFLAVIVKILLLPLTRKQYENMRAMQKMQPLVKDLGKKYKGEELSRKTMELYQQHHVNPFASCLPALVQLPFLIWIFNAIRSYEIAFAKGTFLWIGSSAAHNAPRVMGQPLVGTNLASPDVILLGLYAISNYVTMRMTPATDPQQEQQQKSMALMTTIVFFWMFLMYKWSSAFVLYWLVLNAVSIWQQYEYIYKPHKEDMAANGKTAELVASAPAAPAVIGANTAQPTRVRPRKKKGR